MHCKGCGAQIEEGEHSCSICKAVENKIQVLTVEERQGFSGTTIEQETKGHYHQDNMRASNAYTKQFSIVHLSIWTKLLIAIIALLVVFIALPIVVLVIIVGVVFWFLIRR